MSVLAIPLAAAVYTWANSVENRIASHAQSLALLQQEVEHSDRDRQELLLRMTEVSNRMIQVLERLSRIEAIVTKETPR